MTSVKYQKSPATKGKAKLGVGKTKLKHPVAASSRAGVEAGGKRLRPGVAPGIQMEAETTGSHVKSEAAEEVKAAIERDTIQGDPVIPTKKRAGTKATRIKVGSPTLVYAFEDDNKVNVATKGEEGESIMAKYSKILKEHQSGSIPKALLQSAYNIREASVIKRMLSKNFTVASLSNGEKVIYGKNKGLPKAALKKKYNALVG